MYLGIDFGTSGCRAIAIDGEARPLAQASEPLPVPERRGGRIEQNPALWIEALSRLLDRLTASIELNAMRRLCIDGTSGTILLCDPAGRPLTSALMYNDTSSNAVMPQLSSACPLEEHLCLTPGSGLAKAVWLIENSSRPGAQVSTQADFLAGWLCAQPGQSDYHNVLKLGFDVTDLRWPDWVRQLLPAKALPEVLEPGATRHLISPDLARRFGFSGDLEICAGSTDANAAFLACGCHDPGDAVTSLGSTLVLKLLSEAPIQDLQTGVYSHRLGDYWLTGGASNAGGAVLRQFFSDTRLAELSSLIDPTTPTGLDYYPLTGPGERFPFNDPQKQPVLEPRPASDTMFLQAILEALTRIEKTGYDRLEMLGAGYPRRVFSAGGGARNPQWRELRGNALGVPVLEAAQTEAAYGAALLALRGLSGFQRQPGT